MADSVTDILQKIERGELSAREGLRLINALEMLQNKRDVNPPKKHGNIPL